MSESRYAGGERVVIRDIGARVDPEGESIAEFDGAVGTVNGHWSGYVVVSLDDGPEVLVRPSELEDYVEPRRESPKAPAQPDAEK